MKIAVIKGGMTGVKSVYYMYGAVNVTFIGYQPIIITPDSLLTQIIRC